MDKDTNPNRPMDPTDDALAHALEDLMEGRGQRVEAMPQAQAAADACPDAAAWMRLLNAESRPGEVDRLLAHAARCSACAENLRALDAKPTPEEAAEIATLATATEEWQHGLAARLALTPRRSTLTFAKPRYLFATGAAAALLLIGVFGFSWWQRANTPEQLLAQAYTHSRSFDLRVPGAGFAEVTPETHVRGNAPERESSRLLEARASIERHLENTPEDHHWLQLEARADTLEEKFDPAIDILDRLIAAGPVTSGLLLDDAAAYFERGIANGNENDRATALEYLRHAEELAPEDPVVLFNEAIAMEDRGQVMNAVEAWNRYLRVEPDPKWQAEGRSHLQALQQKLDQLKSHQGRLEQHLATPQAMGSLAGDTAALAALDEELSNTFLPQLLQAAFPLPADRTRGSPCEVNCQSARSLLHSLAASLQRNHQDPWLAQLLPPASSPSGSTPDNQRFAAAANALAQSIHADVEGDYPSARGDAADAAKQFKALGNPAGQQRALIEQAYAAQRASDLQGCYPLAHGLLGHNPEFAWIQIYALTQDALCDPAPGTASENNPAFQRVIELARDSHYALLELRARNLLGAAAVDAGDAEAAWRIYLPTIRLFYAGDHPAMRLYAALSGLEEVEQGTPRVRLALLMQREVVGVLALTESRQLIPTERMNLAAAAIRAGSIPEAQQQMQLAQQELAANGGGKAVERFLAENEIAMAAVYFERRDLAAAGAMLNQAEAHMTGDKNSYHQKAYAVARGQVELAEGHPETAEPLLRAAIVEEERLAGKAAAESIVQAQQDRDLYAVLAAVWQAQGRPGIEILALWERYRLRILGKPVQDCGGGSLSCLAPAIAAAVGKLGTNQVLGQIVLTDRLLLYRARAQGVLFTRLPVRSEDVLAAANQLELAVTSPETPLDEVSRAARRTGDLLIDPVAPASQSAPTAALVLLEPDPMLGNLPWPAVETAAGPIGLHFSLEESPSLLLASHPPPVGGKPLIVGASIASGHDQPLPEVVPEARAVARISGDSNLLLADQATQPQVLARIEAASAIHFAGHAAQQDGSTRLLLAPAGAPGWLDSDLLRRHPPRAARLVVFSACSTGKKEAGWNHGMSDIVATMASLGVPDVVATRWQIDSGSAIPMMDAFYGGLANGMPVPQALTAARRSMLGDVRYQHPYYWAAWYASGSGNSGSRPVFTAHR